MRNRMATYCAVILAAAIAVAACSSPAAPQAAAEPMKDLNASILNYTDENIGVVYVDGDWAGNMGHHLGGGSIAGGASVPVHWRPDFKIKVSWQTDAMWKKDENLLASRMVPVERYADNDGGILWVTFLPSNVIELYVSGYAPGNPNWPGKLPSPETLCIQEKNSLCAGRR